MRSLDLVDHLLSYTTLACPVIRASKRRQSPSTDETTLRFDAPGFPTTARPTRRNVTGPRNLLPARFVALWVDVRGDGEDFSVDTQSPAEQWGMGSSLRHVSCGAHSLALSQFCQGRIAIRIYFKWAEDFLPQAIPLPSDTVHLLVIYLRSLP